MSASTPPTCRKYAARGHRRGRRPGLPEQHRQPAGEPLYIDIDATLVIDHSDNKQDAAPTWKKSFGHHPLLAFLDRPEIAGGEALAGLLRKGNAGSNTAADHIGVLEQALASLPAGWRPTPDADGGPAVVVRCDSAGATHRFATACRDREVGFSFGFPVDTRVWDAVDTLNLAKGWYPAIDAGGHIRDGAWVGEATGLVNLSTWPAGTRLILRKERPHPGAQLRFTDIDGMRITAFITDTPLGAVPGQLAGMELRHRQHARVEDRIRQAKAAGLANLPCHGFDANAAWLLSGEGARRRCHAVAIGSAQRQVVSMRSRSCLDRLRTWWAEFLEELSRPVDRGVSGDLRSGLLVVTV